MNAPLLFSIVIPTYNREGFILNTLDSVFAQTYQHYEIIIVDNCSTDDTVKILQPLADAGRIRLIRHEKNYERARSRNTGMENATGDFLTFLDSDDFMYPNNLADAAEFAGKNPDLKCFHNLYELIDRDKKVLLKYSFPPLDDRLKAIIGGNFMSCIGNFIHRDVYRKFRFDTFRDLTGAEDWEFWLRVIADYEVGRIERINSAILHHETRTVNNGVVEVLESGYRHFFKKFRADAHLSEVYKKYLNRIEASSFQYLAILSNADGLFDKARFYLKEAARTDPRVIFTSRFLRIVRRTVLKLAD